MANSCIAVLARNEIQLTQAILHGWSRGLKMSIVDEDVYSRTMQLAKAMFFTRRYAEKCINMQKEKPLSLYKGLWCHMSKEGTDLTLSFYSQKIMENDSTIKHYSKRLKTKKFEAYIKKKISLDIAPLLKQLHTIRLSGLAETSEILMVKSPLNKFMVRHMECTYVIKFKIKWINPMNNFPLLIIYYAWLLKEFAYRGVVFNKKKKNFKLLKEAVGRMDRSSLRDDAVIDNSKFKATDILMFQLYANIDNNRDRGFKKAKEKGYHTAVIPKLKININRNIFNILSSYFLIPFYIYFKLLASRQGHLFFYILFFHKKCFPIELLMNLYDIKCFFSLQPWNGIEETIVLNKYGAKTAVLHASDLTDFEECPDYAFVAHNIYYTWGDIFYDYHSRTYSVDKQISIGCPYKEDYNRAVSNIEKIKAINGIKNFKERKKTTVFFDSGFGQGNIQFAEDFFLHYLNIIDEFCKENRDVNVLLKPKNEKNAVNYELSISAGKLAYYKKTWNRLLSHSNFSHLDPLKYSGEEIMALADVCINMGMNSPATVALICGKNALYFDNTGNIHHPFAKRYKNVLVFEDKELFFEQIRNILDGKFNCKDVIDENQMRQYDAFSDDKAIGRLIGSLYELTLTK
ncbi:MAG: hypothetical protein HQ579_07075 [Candidatus Omnitrophica bacterium]|nr:hypothetical protein [Candidatus Omnitrophota bacterium]